MLVTIRKYGVRNTITLKLTAMQVYFSLSLCFLYEFSLYIFKKVTHLHRSFLAIANFSFIYFTEVILKCNFLRFNMLKKKSN